MAKDKKIVLIFILLFATLICMFRVNFVNTINSVRYKCHYAVLPDIRKEVNINEKIIAKPEIIEEEVLVEIEPEITYNIPENKGLFKSYMDYKCITAIYSKQYKLQQIAINDSNGLRRIDNYYMVACGSAFGNIGDILEITLDSGFTFQAIKGDEKADIDTDETNKVCIHDGSVVEFIVDSNCLNNLAKKLGNCSCLGFEGYVVNVEVIGTYEGSY